MKYQGITIHKNKNCETWYTRYRKNGVQSYISARTQKDCYLKLKKALKEAQNLSEYEKNAKSDIVTLRDWYKKWLELYKLGKVKQATLNDYESTLKNISENLLNSDMGQIKVAQILENLNKISAERQRQKMYDFFNMLFQTAEDNEIISKNIIKRIEKPRHVKENGQPLTFAEQKRFVDICKSIKHGDLFLVALYQGFRKGEVLAITPQDLDFSKNTISINKAINHYNKFDTTKNATSNRIVPMFEETKRILEKYKPNSKNERIFSISYNRLDVVTNQIEEHLKRKFTIKDLRSTFITRCKEQNVPEFIIQSWVGHTIGSKVTSAVYTKSNKDIDSKYIELINKNKID